MYIFLVISSFYDIFTVLLTEANPISKGGKRCQIILKRAAMLARNLLLKICANLIEFLTILQILEVNIFEKRPIIQIVKDAYKQVPEPSLCNQLNLFNS